jgi:hypothetical protein
VGESAARTAGIQVMRVINLGGKVLAIYTVFRHKKLSFDSGELPTGEIISLQSYV